MPRRADDELDYQRLAKVARKLSLGSTAPVVRLAILADCSTQQLANLVRALLGEAGLRAEIYEGAFDAIELESRSPESALYRFAPQTIIIMNSVQALRAAHSRQPAPGVEFAAQYAAQITRTWDAIQSHCNATILQSTFAMPAESHFGNFDLKVPASLRASTGVINASLMQAAQGRAGVLFHDVDSVASWVGRRFFFDDRAWDLWKMPCSLEHLPRIAKNVVDVLFAARGRIVKCVVADLDNTLWGGVIGDDGMEGIELANGSPSGEAFRAVQSYALACRQRGIVLAVCSKNEEANAREPFRSHPDMLLREEHIAVFVANWIDKASNLRTIAETLNIGLDALVFVDDNPAERARVRQMLPDVAVPELPEDPACYAETLAAASYFEALTISEDDRRRADFYRNNAVRSAEMRKLGSIDEYLASLEMECALSPFDEVGRARISQLINKSNQFNLTTKRYTEVQVAEIEHDPDAFHLQVRLVDKFGDNGMISVVIFKKAGLEWLCDTWLMSCRVLGRRVEEAILQTVVTQARAGGAEALAGRYIPSAKNAMVAEHFGKLGFSLTKREPDGGSLWRLALAEYQDRSLPMRIIGADPGRQIGREQRVALGS
jgi:FkbH-like protein